MYREGEDVLDAALERLCNTVVVDQYTSFLGHGEHANESACPHCGADNSSWLSVDGIHPNAVHYAHIADSWAVAIDAMLGATCQDCGHRP